MLGHRDGLLRLLRAVGDTWPTMKGPADAELELDALLDDGATHVDAGDLELEPVPEGWTPAQFWQFAGDLNERITADLNAIIALSESTEQTPQERLELVKARAQTLLEWLAT